MAKTLTVVGATGGDASLEVSETALRRHGLTLEAVANAIRRSSRDVPGGAIKAGGGEILVRTKGQAYRGMEKGWARPYLGRVIRLPYIEPVFRPPSEAGD